MVDSYFQQPIGILEPERLTGWHVTEGPGADNCYTSRRNMGGGTNRIGTQSADSVAVAVNVDDFCQVVRPVGLTRGFASQERTGRRLTQGKTRRHRGKQISAMKGIRQSLWPPVYLPTIDRPGGTAHDHLEQAVARTDKPTMVGADDTRQPLPADAGIDDAENNRSRRKWARIRRKQIGRGSRIECRRIAQQIDDGDSGSNRTQHRRHLPYVWAACSKIGKQDDHLRNHARRALGCRWPFSCIKLLATSCGAGSAPLAAIGSANAARERRKALRPLLTRREEDEPWSKPGIACSPGD